LFVSRFGVAFATDTNLIGCLVVVNTTNKDSGKIFGELIAVEQRLANDREKAD